MPVPQQNPTPPKRRTDQRIDVNYPAVVRFPNGRTHPCRVTTISPMGAQLEFGPGIELPLAFRLTIPDEMFAADCELRQQSGCAAGVLFTSARLEALARFS